MKYDEAKQKIESLSNKYSARVNSYGYFDVYYEDTLIAFAHPYRYGLASLMSVSAEIPLFEKVYMIMAELAATPVEDRNDEEKFYVKVMDGYLNVDNYCNGPFIDSKQEDSSFKTAFTNQEIEKLKQRKDIPLDWNKVELEPDHQL